jgi:serine/threonine-protein kinase HipA
MTQILVALCRQRHLGRVERDPRGRLTLHYDPSWRADPEAHPLSVSMPLARERHEHDTVEPFLQGLLPDNREVLERWARRFGVTASGPFALLTAVGEECAGAVQFALEERVPELLAAAHSPASVDWIDDAEIGARLAALKRDASATRSPRDTGQFSLAGAQPKTALHRVGERFGVPRDATPTTHILKPPLPELHRHAENEHVCLALARELGLPAARSEVRSFAGKLAIVVERYDRALHSGRIERIHQEDLCQALAVHPAAKYQSDGGPSPTDIATLLRNHSDEPTRDLDTFTRALVFNWLIGGSDAHAKNYALLHAPGSQLRLAPLYDVASILPYPHYDPRRSKLAMKIGVHDRLHDITENDFRRLALDIDLPPESLVATARAMRATLRAALPRVIERAIADGLATEPIHALERALLTRLDDLDRRTI